MKFYVTDTHPLVWALTNDSRLSAAALAAFREADNRQAMILIPPIVLVEMVYLGERNRIPPTLIQNVLTVLQHANTPYRLGAFSIPVIVALQSIARHLIPEMPDRIIAATAKAIGEPLITRDTAISTSGVVQVIW